MVINFMEYIKNREVMYEVNIVDGEFNDIATLQVKFKGGIRSEEDVESFINCIYKVIESNPQILDSEKAEFLPEESSEVMVRDGFREFAEFGICRVDDGFLPVGFICTEIK